MASRRDQLHAHRLAARRTINAFLIGDPDPADSPLPSGAGLLFGSVMIAVLIAAGVALYTLIDR